MSPFDRRSFLSLAGSAAAGSLLSRSALAAATRPNIVFILADDLGYADLSCYGRGDLSTPRLDRMAREGVRFLQSYSNSPVCSATRAALMTGRYQYRLRVGLEEPLRDTAEIGLPPEQPTLPSLLRDAGYRTSLVGKWHLGLLPKFGPLQSGYESFYGVRGGSVDYYSHVGSGGRKDLWDGDQPLDTQGYFTELLTERALRQLRTFTRERTPFFLSVHYTAPHWPWQPPGDDSESRRIAGRSLFHYDGGTQSVYRQMVEHLDAQVGRLLDALAQSGAARDTLVIFTSDNGGERFSNTWPFSGRKGELLEGGVRVPTLLRWPRAIRAGTTSEQVNVTMDWLPTLLAAAGVTPDLGAPSDGINLLPSLAPGAKPVPRKLFWRFKANHQRSVRDGDFKLLKIQNNVFLFNVVEDPLERANLRERHREVFERLKAEWDQWNAAMLPQLPESLASPPSGSDVPDRYGTSPPPNSVDDVSSWPAALPAKL
jgi:arylsulfatase A-like enzyme